MESTANGAMGAPLSDHLTAAVQTRESVADSVRQLLADEERRYQALKAQAEESRQRTEHLRKALEHLTAETGRPAKPAPKAKVAERPSYYRPKQSSLDAVLTVLREAEGPLSTKAVAQASGISGETVTRALRALREDELIRMSGGMGKRGTTYAPMPDVAARLEELASAQ
jgi:CRP-like cAMP-binding protein